MTCERESYRSEDLARKSLSAGRDVRRSRHELLRLFRSGHPRGALPLRRKGDSELRRSAGDDRFPLAWVSPAGQPWPAIRIPRARTVGPEQRPALQSVEAPARSVRQGHGRRSEMERGGLRPLLQRSGEFEERGGQRAVHAEVGGGQSLLRLGERSIARNTMARNSHL